jgi:hypothetical protein
MAVYVSESVATDQTRAPSEYGMPYDLVAIMGISTALAANDILDMVKLPADLVPLGVSVDTDDLDSGTAISLDCGFVTGTPGTTTGRVCGQEFFAGSTVAQAGGIQTDNKVAGRRTMAAPIDRSVGLKVAAGATGFPTVALGTNKRNMWEANVQYAVGDFIILPGNVQMKVTTAGLSGTYTGSIKTGTTQYGPNWQVGLNLTTTDGQVVWTCVTPVVRINLRCIGAQKNF